MSDITKTTINYEAIITTIQRNVVNFCKVLPSHTDNWNKILNEINKPVQALVNYSEQLRHVEAANITYIDGFKNLQEKLLYKIYSEIEEEILVIKELIERLNASTQDIRNKLTVLEKSTIDLNWDEESPIIKGTAFQPPLSRILQQGYDFIMFFTNSLKWTNENFKNLNVRNEETMKLFENGLDNLDVNNKVVISYLALVQYVGNEDAVI